MKFYICGPMTGYEEWNFPAFFEAGEFLVSKGHEVVNPASFGASDDWNMCLKRDLKVMLDCDAILLLPGHEASRGAILEKHVAEAVGLQVWYFFPLADRSKSQMFLQWRGDYEPAGSN